LHETLRTAYFLFNAGKAFFCSLFAGEYNVPLVHSLSQLR